MTPTSLLVATADAPDRPACDRIGRGQSDDDLRRWAVPVASLVLINDLFIA